MTNSEVFVEVWRGEFLECVHRGHAVICGENGSIVDAWGDPTQIILPRSSSKMIQALPLIESGAANAAGLTTEQLALACASHNGAAIHRDRVDKWLGDLDLVDSDLRCGAHIPKDREAMKALLCSDTSPCQIHNNCSGKHAGFLTLNRHLKSGPEYLEIAHPVQHAVAEAFDDVTGETNSGHAIDGCSAPNFATSLHGLARAMAFFATSHSGNSTRERAAVQLFDAMVAHPDLVAGEGRSCTELMRAMNGKVAIKTGADGVYVAIVPELKIGIALKIEDGATRASECAIAALLVRLGVLDANHPSTLKRMNTTQKNCRDLKTGTLRPAAVLLT